MEDTACVSRYFQEDYSIEALSPKICTSSPETSFENSQELSQISFNSNMSEADELNLSQLTMEEQEPLRIEPYFNITPRLIPVSPHYVIEEEFKQNPWALLIATIFLTKTSGKSARPYMKEFFEDFPTPYHVLDVHPRSLERFFEFLGLRKRAYTIWNLSYQYVSARWRRAIDLYGIGKYGEDAYRIFCLAHTDLDPGDRYLKLYLDWLVRQTEFLQQTGEAESEYVIEDPVASYYRISIRDGMKS